MSAQIYKVLRELSRRSKELKISGVGVDKSGKLVVFVSEQSQMALLKSIGDRYGVDIDVQVGEVQLMAASSEQSGGDFFRSWCGEKCICSPPQAGITCHHCASPFENKSAVGHVGYLYDAEKKQVGITNVLDDRPFRKLSFVSLLADVACKLGINFCDLTSYRNKYDFAMVDYQPGLDIPDPIVGVIFAGINKGPFAVAYDIAQVDKLETKAKTDSIANYMGKRVYAYVTHCMTKYCPVVRREYEVAMEGFVNIYAYGMVFTFSPVYYLKPVDVPLIVRHGDESEYVTWAVQPGYSGGVVRALQQQQ